MQQVQPILFSWIVSVKAIVRITIDLVWIQDTDGTVRTYNLIGGKDIYDIAEVINGNGKKGNKSITIRKKPQNLTTVSHPLLFRFASGYALNCYNVITYTHSKFVLNPAYYCKLASTIFKNIILDIYVVIKIYNANVINPHILQLLEMKTNPDIAGLIEKAYLDTNKSPFDFKMIDTPLTGHYYNKPALCKMYDDNYLDIAIFGYNKPALCKMYDDNYLDIAITSLGYSSNIMVLSPEAYHHIYPGGNPSQLQNLWNTCDAMMISRDRLIEKYLTWVCK